MFGRKIRIKIKYLENTIIVSSYINNEQVGICKASISCCKDLILQESHAVLETLFICCKHRRIGLGTKMLNKLCKILKKKKVALMKVHVGNINCEFPCYDFKCEKCNFSGNPIVFYEKYGFKKDEFGRYSIKINV